MKNIYFQGYNLNFQESSFSSYMDWFHSFNYSLLLGILLFVSFIFLFLMFSTTYFKSGKIEYQFGELLCSIFPTLILLLQMVPSLSLLYYYGLMSVDSQLSLKVVGHQWYWSYDYSDIEGLDFDSYMKSLDMLELGDFRLLDVDNRCVLPSDLNVRFCITSADVLHAWALPSLSVKLDAMSGIVSVLNYNFSSVGLFYGQCSEICGANHSFMPIVLEVTLFDFFKYWCLFMLD
uniref:Cytochrome c oxidase subunit 2 n=1 Tax=Aphelenchoides besseyi TaxID=269767 RepID=A0A088CQE8_9BILA|nr:cytochrome c oxidase subunit II [Aphelenchoides besseyi]AII79375.1 cytochrome c oxidase subunit II [Aphelenchoides besseyi]